MTHHAQGAQQKRNLVIFEDFIDFYHYQFSLINNASNYNAGIYTTHFYRVTIPDAAHIQLRRGLPDDEQG